MLKERKEGTMVSSDAHKKAVIKWQKENMRRISLDVRKEYYTDILKPAVDRSGDTMGGFIKKAISEKIERDHLLD